MRPPSNLPVDPACVDSRDCFAKRVPKKNPLGFVCIILNSGYSSDGECPFCKPLRNEKPPGLPPVYIRERRT